MDCEDIHMQLSMWHLDTKIAQAKARNDFAMMRQLKNDKTELKLQLQIRQLSSWNCVEDAYQSFVTLLNRLVEAREVLKENEDTWDAAEECHYALEALRVRVSEMGLDLPAVGGEDETKTTDSDLPQQPDMTPLEESLSQVEYKGVINELEGYASNDNRSWRDRMAEFAHIMPEVTLLEFIADESVAIARDRLSRLPAGNIRLSDDQAFAIAM